jgi:ubiquinone/menaquinone biosynthesis C-methylase UbiE
MSALPDDTLSPDWDDSEGEASDFHPQFTELAPHYDRLMAHVPYRTWVDYVERLFGRYRVRPTSVVDLACGTGNVTFELARRDYLVVGVDNSPGMLDEARRKRVGFTRPVEFVQGDLRELQLPHRFDAALCLYDSLNYVTEPSQVAAAFRGVRSVLREGGYFIFDVNAEHAFEAELFTQDNLRYNEDLKYVWKSEYNPSSRLCQVWMHFEVLDEAEPKRFSERHCERCHSSDELRQWLREASLDPVGEFEAYTFRKPRGASERLFFVARAR